MDGITNSPPRRSREQLQQWVQDFIEEGHLFAGGVHVAEQEDDDEQDTGLVIIQLQNAPASIHIQARGYDALLWEGTLSARDIDLTLSPHHIASLAAELVVAGNLCSYLQFRSLEWNRQTGTH